ncbi:MAG: HEAT repeat domain-containing protein [Pirellulales bacterium]|nr:HEAT repeat domain-containing protein [Pirellulales bacterium]
MSSGPKKTFDFLSKSENRAATDILVHSIKSKDPTIRHRGLAAIMDRLDPAGHQEVFRRLGEFDDKCREVILRRSRRLESVATSAVKDATPQACKAACESIVTFRLYDALPGLISVLSSDDSPNIALAATTVLRLADAFYLELSGAEQQSVGHKTTDMDTLRRRVTTSLEEAARKYFKHQQRDAVEAFLLVAKPQNATLRQILRNPDEKSHEPLIDILSTSEHGGVMRLLLGFLEDPQMPRPVIDVLTGRQDPRFVEHLLQRTGTRESRTRNYSETLSRFDSISWAKPENETLDGLDDEGQNAAVFLIMSSGMGEEERLEVLGHLLLKGNVGGRRAAAQALKEIKGNAATGLVVRAINDSDPHVRAHVLKQLRPRGVPGAMSLLLRMAEDPSPVIKEALREAMPEFSLRQFMMTFDSLPDNLQQLAGYLVRQIDPSAPKLVAEEMKVLSPVRRRRAVQAAAAMGLVKDLEEDVAKAVSDEDHMVRVAAATALAESEQVESWEALRDAMLDRSVVVQEAAEQSLMRISRAFLSSLQQQMEEEGQQREETAGNEETSPNSEHEEISS